MKQILPIFFLFLSLVSFSQDVLYVNDVDLGSFVNPTSDQDTTIILDDINILRSDLGGNDSVTISRITFGIGRTQGAEAAKLKFYYSPFNTSFTDLENTCTFPPIYFAELDIETNSGTGGAFYYTIGDGVAPLFKLKVEELGIFDDAFTFFLGVSIDKKIKSSLGGLVRRGSGWSLTSAGSQSPWIDSAWAFSPRFNQGGQFTVVDQDGAAFPQTYNVGVEGTAFSVMPVTLADFSASIKNNNAILQWQTVTESNNKGFDIERSTDGKTFTKIGFVSGNGTTIQKKDYSYTDFNINQLNKNLVYYRLRQLDFDGHMDYSKTIPLSISKIINWAVSPNPVSAQTAVRLSLEKSSQVQIQVVNSAGIIVKSINKGLLQEGAYSIPLEMQNFASGVYMIRLILDDNISTQKIVK